MRFMCFGEGNVSFSLFTAFQRSSWLYDARDASALISLKQILSFSYHLIKQMFKNSLSQRVNHI